MDSDSSSCITTDASDYSTRERWLDILDDLRRRREERDHETYEKKSHFPASNNHFGISMMELGSRSLLYTFF